MIVARFRTAEDGIARETALLQEGRPSMLLWQASENAIAVPHALTRSAGFDKAAAKAAAQGWSVTTRGSGGGLVPQGPHTLNLAIISPCPTGVTMEDGYRMICGSIGEALTRFEITSSTGLRANAFCDGDWNVIAQDRKLAGTAQRWRATSAGRIALIHAAILMHPPERSLWPVLKGLHRVAMPKSPSPKPEAHIAMEHLLPGKMSAKNFPGALVRAVEDRLTAFAHRKEEAA